MCSSLVAVVAVVSAAAVVAASTIYHLFFCPQVLKQSQLAVVEPLPWRITHRVETEFHHRLLELSELVAVAEVMAAILLAISTEAVAQSEGLVVVLVSLAQEAPEFQGKGRLVETLLLGLVLAPAVVVLMRLAVIPQQQQLEVLVE
jgi:hypothetical protein